MKLVISAIITLAATAAFATGAAHGKKEETKPTMAPAAATAPAEHVDCKLPANKDKAECKKAH